MILKKGITVLSDFENPVVVLSFASRHFVKEVMKARGLDLGKAVQVEHIRLTLG